MQRRRGRLGKIGDQVVPGLGDAALVELIFHGFHRDDMSILSRFGAAAHLRGLQPVVRAGLAGASSAVVAQAVPPAFLTSGDSVRYRAATVRERFLSRAASPTFAKQRLLSSGWGRKHWPERECEAR